MTFFKWLTKRKRQPEGVFGSCPPRPSHWHRMLRRHTPEAMRLCGNRNPLNVVLDRHCVIAFLDAATNRALRHAENFSGLGDRITHGSSRGVGRGAGGNRSPADEFVCISRADMIGKSPIFGEVHDCNGAGFR